jgi:hypothetical protein
MSFRLVVGALIASAFVAMAASPALACKGAESLLRDDFTDTDPAWDIKWPDNSSFDIGGGKVVAKSKPGAWAPMYYNGSFFPAADACVTITLPSVRNPEEVWGGLLFLAGANYICYIRPDGKAGVTRVDSTGWLDPVSARPFAAIKQDAPNTLRVVWSAPQPENSGQPSDPSVTIYINDQKFIKFKVKPNDDRQIGLAVQSNGNDIEFTHLQVTQ